MNVFFECNYLFKILWLGDDLDKFVDSSIDDFTEQPSSIS